MKQKYCIAILKFENKFYIFFVLLSASHSVLAYATVRGLIYGWDIRASKTIWKLQNDPALGTLICDIRLVD